ncbi:MAG: hypothetical protein MSC30_09105 [Gaiellaceae bacterium MAG52_C11]|nr:hypothetical protein [Candidatus Gaiellasilicea maunaloa]
MAERFANRLVFLPLLHLQVVVLDLDARRVGGELHLQVAACLRGRLAQELITD